MRGGRSWGLSRDSPDYRYGRSRRRDCRCRLRRGPPSARRRRHWCFRSRRRRHQRGRRAHDIVPRRPVVAQAQLVTAGVNSHHAVPLHRVDVHPQLDRAPEHGRVDGRAAVHSAHDLPQRRPLSRRVRAARNASAPGRRGVSVVAVEVEGQLDGAGARQVGDVYRDASLVILRDVVFLPVDRGEPRAAQPGYRYRLDRRVRSRHVSAAGAAPLVGRRRGRPGEDVPGREEVSRIAVGHGVGPSRRTR